MLVSLSHHLLKHTNQLACWSIKSLNSWALAIKNAASSREALYLYSKMHRLSVPIDSFSILFTLKSCTPLQNLTVIQHIHAHIVKLGFSPHVYVATSLLHAYVVTSFENACGLFEEMPERNTVTWNTMISGYSRLGDVERARAVFEEMPLRDVASWSAVIAAYVNCGNYEHGLALFREMMATESSKPDQVTVGSVLSGCAHMGSLGLLVGKSVHGFIAKNGWELNVELGTILVEMYAKCGFMKNACWVFELMPERNVMTWTALICGSAQHGCTKEALSLFEMMQKAGVRPNELTITGILSACVHTGLVEKGRKYFKMIEECGLEPRIQHYGCMVNLLGKAGLLEEAHEIIRTMRFEPNIVIWGSFLSACREHKQFEMAERVIDQVLGMVKPENDGGVYSLICDLYVLGEKWDEAERLRKLMAKENVRKARGSSFIRSL
jgi:pentatricopeptide repeat protein